MSKESDALGQYIRAHSLRQSKAQAWLEKATKESAPMNIMLISAVEMQFLQNLALSIGVKRAIEIGVYTGYSTLSMAEVVPENGGKVVALDISDQLYEKYCKPAWEMAGVLHKIDFRLGPAVQSLESMLKAGEAGTYDYACIDADKENYIHYYELCLKLLRPGGVIAVDNVLWSQRVIDPKVTDPTTQVIREFNDFVAKDERVRISMINIGDGVTLAFKK